MHKNYYVGGIVASSCSSIKKLCDPVVIKMFKYEISAYANTHTHKRIYMQKHKYTKILYIVFCWKKIKSQCIIS